MTTAFGNFFAAHLADIYLAYGGAFVLLGVVIYLQPKEDEALHFASDLWLVALFALLHGSRELFDSWRLNYAVELSPGARQFAAAWLAVSYLPLLEFGRRIIIWCCPEPAARGALSVWIYLPSIGAVVAAGVLAPDSAHGIASVTRLFLALPAAGLTALGLLGYLRREGANLRRLGSIWPMVIAVGSFAAYGLLAGLVQPKGSVFPVLPDETDFARVLVMPVQIFRAACAIAIAFSLAHLLRQVNIQARRAERAAIDEARSLNAQLERRVRERTEALEQANAWLREAQEVGRVGNWVLDPATNTAVWSDEQYRLLGYAPGSVEADSGRFLHAVHPDDRAAIVAEMQRVLNPDEKVPYHIVHRVVTPAGERVLEERGRVSFNEQGKAVRVFGTTADVTEAHRARQALELALAELRVTEQQQRELRTVAQREQGRMAALLSAMNIGILFEDGERRVEYVNPAFRRIWAIPDNEEVVGITTDEMLAGSRRQFTHAAHASKHLLQVLDTHETSERFELELADERVLAQQSYPVLGGDGQALGRLWVYEDITHERKTAQQLLYLAERDPLTGLFNRHRFQAQLEQMIGGARRSGTKFALLYFDLDDFKAINDTFGHRAGDSVLVRAGSQVIGVVRAGDVFARLGGDEFAVLCSHLPGDQVGGLPTRIIESISSIPFRFGGRNLRLTASIGVAVFPDHGATADELVANADAAMYQAKSEGKNTWAVYDPQRDMSEIMVERISWTQRIAQALERGLFEMHYQGIYGVEDLGLRHLEALVRMRDPAQPQRVILPGQFIPIAEKSGQIGEIDRWVIEHCIGRLARHPQVPAIAVNISARSLDDATLPQHIRARLAHHGVDPRRLIVELTESAAVSDIQEAQRFIEALRQIGCEVYLDDFGSGFSTFVYLKHLDVRILKIDGIFIQDLARDTENQALVKAMVDAAHALRKKCIAEFVEDTATLALVRRLGVEFVQGYHLDYPVAEHPAFGIGAG
ncbi:MAG: EAL domain-containing protein [Betaproteobacteria bacterium]|nr:EAL domain-containing protein [Betaproteobacteria bacterium]